LREFAEIEASFLRRFGLEGVVEGGVGTLVPEDVKVMYRVEVSDVVDYKIFFESIPNILVDPVPLRVTCVIRGKHASG
jgi:hypothetical protein